MPRVLPVLLLLAVTAIWGWTFVVVRDAVQAYPVLPFLALRFAIAAVVLAPALLRSGRGVAAGLLPGVALSAGYLCQTAGLQYTTASKAGLFTGLFVVFTPLLEFAIARRMPSLETAFAVAGALTGTALLAGVGPGVASGTRELLGDSLEILTAVAFSVHILLLSRVSPCLDATRVATGQLLVAVLLFTFGAAGTATMTAPSGAVWLALVITGVLASAVAFLVQTFVQQRISASRTALILVAEPAFATLFGVLLAGDRLSGAQASGAGLILLTLLVHEAIPLWRPSAPRRVAGS